MTSTVIGTIGDAKSAQKLVNELVKAGFKQQDVELLEGSEQEILAKVVERGFAEDDARAYAKAARGGKTLVAARAPENKVDAAVEIIERYESAAAEGAQERGETVQEIEEELSVGKQVKEREETVKDTVRRTEVEVEEVGTKPRKPR
jgi:hypothetical protein